MDATAKALTLPQLLADMILWNFFLSFINTYMYIPFLKQERLEIGDFERKKNEESSQLFFAYSYVSENSKHFISKKKKIFSGGAGWGGGGVEPPPLSRRVR